MLKKLLYLIIFVITFLASFISVVFYMYQPEYSGTVYLERAKSAVTIIREKDTGIPHIYADDILSAVYA